jgi:hypothetical protein
MAGNAAAQRAATALAGGTGAKPGSSDSVEAAGIYGVTEAIVDPNQPGVERLYDVNDTTGVIKVGLINIPGEQDFTSKWTPTGSPTSTTGTWDGLQRR